MYLLYHNITVVSNVDKGYWNELKDTTIKYNFEIIGTDFDDDHIYNLSLLFDCWKKNYFMVNFSSSFHNPFSTFETKLTVTNMITSIFMKIFVDIFRDTTAFANQIEGMMRDSLGIDKDELVEEEEELVDEIPEDEDDDEEEEDDEDEDEDEEEEEEDEESRDEL